MYAAFNLKIELDTDSLYSDFEQYKHIGLKIKEIVKSKIGNNLKKYINNGIIDGISLSDDWFKTVTSDVFISYSHNDEDIAIAVAGYLYKEFRLNVFVDSFLWGSADTLLRNIDDIYCKQDPRNYNYTKRNLSTSHVHAMLSMAIIKVMDMSEIVIFLNTNNSIPKVDTIFSEKYTQSPWIYEEIVFASLLRQRHWRNHRGALIYESAYESLQVEYKVPISEMKEISLKTISDWKKEYNKWLSNEENYGYLLSSGCTHPLNFLYKMVFDEEE